MATSSIEDFRELLNNDIRLDLEKLKDFSRHGIPNEVRGDVWKCLLGVQESDIQIPKTLIGGGRRSPLEADSTIEDNFETRQQKRMIYANGNQDGSEIRKRLRGALNRYQNQVQVFRLNPPLLNMLENVLRTYLDNHSSVDFSPALINLCAPLVYILQDEVQVYLTFERLLVQLEQSFCSENLQSRLANFNSLFRTSLPDLYEYFEEEEVSLKDWAVSWLQYLLAKEMPLDCLVRLWDTYLTDGLELHPFVCLAVLKRFKDNLEEMEQSEIRAFLHGLPYLDIDEILQIASNIQHDVLILNQI